MKSDAVMEDVYNNFFQYLSPNWSKESLARLREDIEVYINDLRNKEQ